MKILFFFSIGTLVTIVLILKFSNTRNSTQFEIDQIQIRKEFGQGPSKNPQEDDGEWYKGPPTIFSTPLRK